MPEHAASVPLGPHAERSPGLSVRWRLTLSYVALVAIAGAVLLGVVALWLLRYVPDGAVYSTDPLAGGSWAPNRTDLIRAFVPAATWALLALIALSVLGGWLLAGRVLRPLAIMADTARAVGEGELSARMALPGRDDEFRRLSDVFDGMLDRIQADLERERRFAANASHELRTPLAITRALLDVAQAEPDPDVPQLLERLRTANERAIALTEALLLLARLDARPPQQVEVDLSLAAEGAIELLHEVAAAHDVRIDAVGDPVFVRGDAALLDQLALNLVQNALVHNLPSGGSATVRTVSLGGRGALVVENTGERLDPDLVATLVEPFQRGSGRAREGGHGGSGLGLAIAGSIVDVLDGSLVLTARPEGGLRVEASFPLA
uniref:sensor histidine kinase n=1 Tax=Microbacterium azadirachtae TaxID=582680 RepID=UPI000B8A23E7|nr:HAMP domain-containing sensor histidine kinase [Microbacterium azadirachtae]